MDDGKFSREDATARIRTRLLSLDETQQSVKAFLPTVLSSGNRDVVAAASYAVDALVAAHYNGGDVENAAGALRTQIERGQRQANITDDEAPGLILDKIQIAARRTLDTGRPEISRATRGAITEIATPRR